MKPNKTYAARLRAVRFEQPCPIRDVLDRIGDQWSLLALLCLAERTMRFNELMRDIGDISKQMLSRTLKHLEQDGFILRTVYPEVPPRVEYTLSEIGESLRPVIDVLKAWGETHRERLSCAGEPEAPHRAA